VQEPLVGQVLLIIEASPSHSDTPHSVGLLWTSDRHVAEASTWKHTTLKKDTTHAPGIFFCFVFDGYLLIHGFVLKILLFGTFRAHFCVPHFCRRHYLVLSNSCRWPRALRRGSAAARLPGLRVRIPSGALMSVSCECRVCLSGRGLCDGPVSRPEESCRVWVCMSMMSTPQQRDGLDPSTSVPIQEKQNLSLHRAFRRVV